MRAWTKGGATVTGRARALALHALYPPITIGRARALVGSRGGVIIIHIESGPV